MRTNHYGRKFVSFDEGDAELTSTVVTESPLPDEDEAAFTHRLLEKYPVQRGTIEVVFRRRSANLACPGRTVASYPVRHCKVWQ